MGVCAFGQPVVGEAHRTHDVAEYLPHVPEGAVLGVRHQKVCVRVCVCVCVRVCVCACLSEHHGVPLNPTHK